MNIIITGNAGSGKTWLARKLGTAEGAIIHLDALYWQPGAFKQKREKAEVQQLITQSLARPQWIIEGVFGELLAPYLPRATLFLWLDMPWGVCKKRLEQRGSERTHHMGRQQSATGLRQLLTWAEQYAQRHDLRSRSGHRQLFASFPGPKLRLCSEAEVNHWVSRGVDKEGNSLYR